MNMLICIIVENLVILEKLYKVIIITELFKYDELKNYKRYIFFKFYK